MSDRMPEYNVRKYMPYLYFQMRCRKLWQNNVTVGSIRSKIVHGKSNSYMIKSGICHCQVWLQRVYGFMDYHPGFWTGTWGMFHNWRYWRIPEAGGIDEDMSCSRMNTHIHTKAEPYWLKLRRVESHTRYLNRCKTMPRRNPERYPKKYPPKKKQ